MEISEKKISSTEFVPGTLLLYTNFMALALSVRRSEDFIHVKWMLIRPWNSSVKVINGESRYSPHETFTFGRRHEGEFFFQPTAGGG